MNLKKSKFLKRIQMLRRISKEKLRQEKERSNRRIDWDLENVFCERSGGSGVPRQATVYEVYESCETMRNDVIDKINEKEKLKQMMNLHQGGHQNVILKESENLDLSPFEENSASGLIHMNNSCFPIKYEVTAKGNTNSSIDNNDSMPSISSARGSICVAHSRYSMIGTLAKSLGYKLAKDKKLWSILWTDSLPGVDIYKNMKRFQQINHFPGMMEICRKDLLSRNLNRMLKLYPKDYKIFPKTWIFPADYGEALNYANNSSKVKMFILKPDAGTQGRGIRLTNDLKSINPTDRLICQTYIDRPLLIDGYKFDLRVYALLTSVDPLRIFVYNEGLARFATSKYLQPSVQNNTDLYMHLTNYSVNKRNSQYELCDDDDCGSKRKFSAINNWLRRRNYDVQAFWSKIDDIIIKTLLSAWPVLRHNYNACFPGHDKIQACFEILGFDILVDSKLRPYVLEVNHSPSFHTAELVDREVKKPLIKDTLLLVSTALADKRQILREDRKRIRQRLLKVKQRRSVPLAVNSSSTNSLRKNSEPAQRDEEKYPAGDCPISALAQQIAWEESHLGNFRRVMPPSDPRKLNYYCQFYGQQNQASIFAETAASRKREEVSKQLRLQLEEKKRKQMEILNRKCSIKFEERRRRRSAVPRNLLERRRLMALRNQAHWIPGFITPAEERLRLTQMQLRNDLLKDMKILEMLYSSHYKAGSLTNTDIIKFPDLYRNLESGSDIPPKTSS